MRKMVRAEMEAENSGYALRFCSDDGDSGDLDLATPKKKMRKRETNG